MWHLVALVGLWEKRGVGFHGLWGGASGVAKLSQLLRGDLVLIIQARIAVFQLWVCGQMERNWTGRDGFVD
jgi:hypothetical protein